MIATENTQPLTTFRSTVSETLDRVNQTGEAEIITVDGEARGVLLAPAVYDDLTRDAQLTRDVAVMRRAIRQYEAGECKEVNVFFDEVRATLLAMKAAEADGKGE